MLFYEETTKSRRTVTLFVRYKIGISSLFELTYTNAVPSRCSRKCLWAISCFYCWADGGGKRLKENGWEGANCDTPIENNKRATTTTTHLVCVYVKNAKIHFSAKRRNGNRAKVQRLTTPFSPVSFCPYLFRLCFCSHTHHLMIFFVWHEKEQTAQEEMRFTCVCVCVVASAKTLSALLCVYINILVVDYIIQLL